MKAVREDDNVIYLINKPRDLVPLFVPRSL